MLPPPPRLLYVEDDDDIRDAITDVLSSEGFDVTAVSTAEDALGALVRSNFQILLTDYQLPGENAAWLLRQAKANDHLLKTPVIILSANRHPEGVEGYVLLQKPVDLDVLSAALNQALSDGGHPELPLSPALPPPADALLVLTLYVTSGSHTSQKAKRNILRILKKYDAASIRLDICDIAQLGDQSGAGHSLEEDRIVVTPTLVKQHPSPRVWIVGDLSASEVVEDVISAGLATLLQDR